MLSTKNKSVRKLTKEELKIRREKKRIHEIEKELNKQYSIKSFHRIFSYVTENADELRDEELKTADSNIEFLLSQIK